MDHGFTIEYLYHDADIVEIQVSASNGRFAGSTAVYVARHELRESALLIEGFPTSRLDTRELVWGALEPEHAGGAAKLAFNCIDAAGHTEVSIRIEDANAMQSALVVASVEPAGIDKFIPQLRAIDEDLSGRATLEFSR